MLNREFNYTDLKLFIKFLHLKISCSAVLEMLLFLFNYTVIKIISFNSSVISTSVHFDSDVLNKIKQKIISTKNF